MKPIKVLFLTAHPVDDASSRYRIFQFLPGLERQGFDCHVRPFTTSKLFMLLRRGEASLFQKLLQTLLRTLLRLIDVWRASAYDIVFIHREAFPFFQPWMERLVLAQNAKVIFGLDDAIYIGRDRESSRSTIRDKVKSGDGLFEVVRRSALIVAGSKVIANDLLPYNIHITVIPTVIDLVRYQFKLPVESPDQVLTIGWYGSDSTSKYVRAIETALQRLAQAHPGRVRFRFFGDLKLQLDLPNSQIFPFCLETEIDDLSSIDIGLMPLPDNPWARAKCAFKAIQYMGLGIPTVVSPVGMSAEVVADEINGLHATSQDDWFHALDRLVREAPLRRRLATSARATVERDFSLQVWEPIFANILRDVHQGKAISANFIYSRD